MKIISVSDLNGYIKQKIDSDMFLRNIWVRGEISNFKHHSSGHMYFTLKDKSGAIRCVMFRSKNGSLPFPPRDGMAVIARGYVTVYERDGQYQLYVEEMHQQGIGALYVAFLQLKEKLEKEGLFDRDRKKPLPAFPGKIGVVTSPTGAAVRDIINVITRRFPQVQIVLIPVAVQGDEAPRQIAEGIKTANSLGGLDVLIVGRGGGSIEELWAFNTEIVARGIAGSLIPVVSAVGHETDFTIADFVADMRAPTPSAAAEMVVPDCNELMKTLVSLQQRMAAGMNNSLTSLHLRLARAVESPVMTRPMDGIYRKMQDLDYLVRRLHQTAVIYLNNRQNSLSLQISRLDDLSPLATLKRGYSLCLDDGGKVIRNVSRVSPGDKVEIVIHDGVIDCTVERVKEGEYGKK
ncbi:MAG: exodeoxyribonuclease VII large subunit [Firmicutes bacterium HGW-Firmicutes-14]|nr:MAG: exodeoxyribonuclease VII large subunit [Firmicutes bacterium HGW-Firmicutes-14]